MAAETKFDVETLLDAKTLGLFASLPKAINGKWSGPLGQPDSQYACHVNPLACVWSTKVCPLRQQP